MDFEYKDEYGYFTSACLNVTDSCNLACTYCFVEQQPHFMSLDTAKKCVDFLAENIKKNPRYNKGTLNYFGGEPTLMWDEIIVPITEYIKKIYGDMISLGITTNGTLLNKERIDFLSNNKINVLLSCDGGPKAQNMNRPCRNGQNSFDLVEKNIPYLLEKYPNITLRSTISTDSVDEVFNNYIFGIEKGFKSHFMMPNIRGNWSEDQLKRLNKQVELIYGHIFKQFIFNKMPALRCSPIDKAFADVIENDLQHITGNFKNTNISRSIYRCGLGTTSASFGYNGNIYGCQEQTSYSDGYFYIGNIFDGIDKERHAKLLADYSQQFTHICQTPGKCDDCILSKVCHKYGCPSTNYDVTGNMLISPDVECEWKKMLYTNAKNIVEELVKTNNKIFNEYLHKYCEYDKLLNETVRCK